MAKSEENMKKALMRGVCALNLEAMSIFDSNNLNTSRTNENLANKQPENMTRDPAEHADESLFQALNNRVLSAPYSNNYPPSTSGSVNDLYESKNKMYNDSSNRNLRSNSTNPVYKPSNTRLKEKENIELARKVKSYCEFSLANKNKSSESVNNDRHILSELARARLSLANNKERQNIVQEEPIADANDNEEELGMIDDHLTNKIVSNSKAFSELTQHSIRPVIITIKLIRDGQF